MDKKVVIKQDINFLEKPLWFVKLRHDGVGFVWNDTKGYEYRSGYKVPDKVDSLILLYLLSKSQQIGYQKHLELTRYEILQKCGLINNHEYYYKRLEDSLKRWKNVAIEFRGTFYDGKEYLSLYFGIIDEGGIDKETKLVHVDFNEKWLLKIKESQFFKYVNFEYYKSLKRPLSAKLYEILCKTFKGRDRWSIHLTLLGEKLTLYVRQRNGKQLPIYASDILTAIKPAINEINKLAKTPDIIKKTGIPPEDLFTIEYEITGVKQERVITFYKIPVPIPKQVITKAKKAVRSTTIAPIDVEPQKTTPHPELALPPGQAKQVRPEPPQPKQEISPEIQALREAALYWLDTIPGFHPDRKVEIAQLPIAHVVERYPGIKQKYTKMVERGKAPGAGWIYEAFIKGYIFPEDVEKAKEKEGEAINRAMELKKEKIMQFIEEHGGFKNLLYRGQEIGNIFSDQGLLTGSKGTERVMPWDCVELEWLMPVCK